MITSYAPLIRDVREQRGLSQAEVAEKLGLSRSSYIAVEQGKRDLTLTEFDKLSNVLGVSMEDIRRGEVPHYDKYREMILAFLRKNEFLTKTKLAKLLYLADFSWFYTHLQSMSGMQYRKIQYGPVSDTYFRLIDEMRDAGEIDIDVTDDGAMRISETRGAAKTTLNLLSAQEQRLIDKIDTKWKGKRTADIVAFTHKQMPYMFAEDNAIVSYDVFTQEDPNDIY